MKKGHEKEYVGRCKIFVFPKGGKKMENRSSTELGRKKKMTVLTNAGGGFHALHTTTSLTPRHAVSPGLQNVPSWLNNRARIHRLLNGCTATA